MTLCLNPATDALSSVDPRFPSLGRRYKFRTLTYRSTHSANRFTPPSSWTLKALNVSLFHTPLATETLTNKMNDGVATVSPRF